MSTPTHQRRSLLDQAGISDQPPSGKGKPSSGGKGGKIQGDTIKLAAALTLFVVAAVLIAWYAELFSFTSAPPPPPPTQEEVQALDQRTKEIQTLQQQGKVESAGSQ
ncbi:MAG: hypothetical protein WD749_05655 [Phycisphaerales bacterium]